MGDYMSTPDDTKHCNDGQADGLKYGACGMQGWRKSMEDTHIAHTDLLKGVHLFGVFDGHGGHEVAVFVQKHMASELLKLEQFKTGNYQDALKLIFLQMDRMMRDNKGKELLKKYTKTPPFKKQQDKKGTKKSALDPPVYKPTVISDDDDVAMYVGCTACVALITPENIYCANCGDSRGVASVKTVSCPLSQDHKPENKQEEKRIRQADGFVEENRVNGVLNLSRSLGDFEYKNPKFPPEKMMITACPQIRFMKRSKDIDFIILACDGIWDCLTNQAAVDFVNEQRIKSKSTNISSYIETMFSKILAKDTHSSGKPLPTTKSDFLLLGGIGCDNMTCLIVSFK